MERKIELVYDLMAKGKKKKRGGSKIPRGGSKPKGQKEKYLGGVKRIPQVRR